MLHEYFRKHARHELVTRVETRDGPAYRHGSGLTLYIHIPVLSSSLATTLTVPPLTSSTAVSSTAVRTKDMA